MSISDVIVVEAGFFGKGKYQILSGVDKLFWPASRRVCVGASIGVLY